MILVNRLWFVCRTNKYPMKVLWSAGKGERVILDNSKIYSVLLCKQCVQNFSKSVSVQSSKHLPFSRVFSGYVRHVLQCIRRPKSTNANSAPLKSSGNKSEKLEASKISKQEFKRLLGLAKPERWKLAGAIVLLLVSSTVTMAIPFALGKVIDIIYTEDSKQMKSNLNALCATLLGVFILGGLCNFGRVYLMNLSGKSRALSEVTCQPALSLADLVEVECDTIHSVNAGRI
ncbi:ATP-binding cassette sub- B member 10, mitochondrial [Homalodisca vitripennis]|nr:ATP-binding cassette sub- B member 10, mitochondrial [Homalodisca vitripennis]